MACIHTLSHALQHRTLPPSQGGLRSCHVSIVSGSRLSNRKGSGAVTCTVALNHASLQGRAPVRHMSYRSGFCLPVREGSDAPSVLQLRILSPCKGGLRCATCPVARDPTSLHGRAPVPPPHALGFLWAMSLKHKEKPIRLTFADRLACSQCTRACFQGA
jgi:hypothetical protein